MRSVSWRGAGVSVDASSGSGAAVQIGAARCICTIPVWLLPSIELDPGLSDTHLQALGELAVCKVHKVVLHGQRRCRPAELERAELGGLSLAG